MTEDSLDQLLKRSEYGNVTDDTLAPQYSVRVLSILPIPLVLVTIASNSLVSPFTKSINWELLDEDTFKDTVSNTVNINAAQNGSIKSDDPALKDLMATLNKIAAGSTSSHRFSNHCRIDCFSII